MARSDARPERMPAGEAPTFSTHVLDTQAGLPRPGVKVRLVRLLDDGAEVPAGRGVTDVDGRIRSLLRGELIPGDYRLYFDLRAHGGEFFESVTLGIHIEDAARSYHVPLLLAPYAMTTYRGS
ncbi:MAG: hydroxyisourate hydrolase [Chloroflexota bacterium]|nr:hydroxyisourate hydrolase [Chloroflexota bacterium]